MKAYKSGRFEYKIRVLKRLIRQPGWLASRLFSGVAAVSFVAILLLGAAADAMDVGVFLRGVFAAGATLFISLAVKSVIDGGADNG